jgi:hypothetical protein
MKAKSLRVIAVVLTLGVGLVGCSGTAIFNPALINQQDGSIFPLAPQERNAFVLVRVNNSTNQAIEFRVTVEREVLDPDNPDLTNVEQQSFNLFTPPATRANDLGVLVNCPIVRVGLGENLDQPLTSAGMFVGAQAVGVGGIGVPAGVNPLDTRVGNFACGDTVIFQAVALPGSPGGVAALAYVLDADSQADEITGLDTFANARSFINDSLLDEDE